MNSIKYFPEQKHKERKDEAGSKRQPRQLQT